MNGNSWNCNICQQLFTTKAELTLHVEKGHFGTGRLNTRVRTTVIEISDSDDDTSVSKEKRSCDKIPDQLVDNESSSHKNIAGSSIDLEKGEIVDIASSELVDQHNKPRSSWVICNICVEEFSSQQILKDHIKSAHFGIKNFKCATCSSLFQHKELLIKHCNDCQGKECTKTKSKRVKCQRNVKDKLRKISKSKNRRRSLKIAKSDNSKKKADKKSDKKSMTSEISDKNSSTLLVQQRRQKMPNKVEQRLKSCYICSGVCKMSQDALCNHMRSKHSLNEAALDIKCKIIEQTPLDGSHVMVNKCLRCGYQIMLMISNADMQKSINDQVFMIQMHVSLDCIRSPFNQQNVPLARLYCTVCGQVFEDVSDHDEHVTTAHYSTLIANSLKANPFPFILNFIAPKKEVKITGPYVCPYDCSKPRFTRNCMTALLKHTKHCHKRFGAVAIQCNSCFKMIICDNSEKKLKSLELLIRAVNCLCCDKVDKTFKCYCCQYDYRWDVITQQLGNSIQLIRKALAQMRSWEYKAGVKKLNCREILNHHPTIHSENSSLNTNGGSTFDATFSPYHQQGQQRGCKNSIFDFVSDEDDNVENCTLTEVDGSFSNDTFNILDSCLKVKDKVAVEQVMAEQYPPPDKNPATEEKVSSQQMGSSVPPTAKPANVVPALIFPAFKCPECDPSIPLKLRAFSKREDFILHMSEHEPDVDSPSKSLIHCFLCSRNFLSRKFWRDHIDTYHSNCQLLKCGECDMEFQRAVDLQHHILFEHHDITFECNFCNAMFGTEMELINHHGEDHAC